MDEIQHRTVETNGIKMHLAEQGEGPLVLMLHGWPESWYSWRHQLPALAAASYHAVAPDVRGYGRTDAPEAIDSYTMKNHTADAVGVLDALGEETAVIVGHDWGAPMAWSCAVLYPERFPAVVGMSVPFRPRSPMPPTQLFKQVFGDNFFYILYFQEPGVAEAEFNKNPRRFLRVFMHTASGDAARNSMLPQKKKGAKLLDGMPEPERQPDWLTEADLDYYVSEFERTGLSGGFNRYRNMDRDWEQLPELEGAKVQQPALFVTGERDPVGSFTNAASMKESVPNLRDIVTIQGAGHWVQQEAPEETNKALIDFLRGL